MLHGLVLSGGGAKGGFEAGAAAAILEYYKHTDSPITMLSGTSVGAINAAGIAAGGPRYPMEIWRNISNNKIYRRSTFMYPWRFWRLGAAFDSSPLWKLITSHIGPDALAHSDYRIFIHTTEITTRRPVVFSGKHPDVLTGIYASASIPGAFPPVLWEGHWLVDGGTVDNSPIRSLVREGCKKITVIYLDDELPQPSITAADLDPITKVERPNAAESLAASIEAMMDAHFRRDLKNVELINKLVAVGHPMKEGHRKIHLQVFGPDRDLGNSLDFDTKRMRILIDRGYHQALRWLTSVR